MPTSWVKSPSLPLLWNHNCTHIESRRLLLGTHERWFQMVIRTVVANDYGNYICEGRNDQGTGHATVKLFGEFSTIRKTFSVPFFLIGQPRFSHFRVPRSELSRGGSFTRSDSQCTDVTPHHDCCPDSLNHKNRHVIGKDWIVLYEMCIIMVLLYAISVHKKVFFFYEKKVFKVRCCQV